MVKKKAESDFTKVVEQIRKTYGDGAVRKGGEYEGGERMSSGSFAIDYESGGGFPCGKPSEIFGVESVTKSALVYTTIAKAQAAGKKKAFILDIEGSFDGVWVSALGCDPNLIDVSQPEWGEKALDIFIAVVDSREYYIVALDSVAVVTAEGELDGDHDENHMCLQARLMARCMRKLTSALNHPENNTAVIMVNQLQSTMAKYGPPETTKGGRAVKHAAAMRLKMRTKEYIEGKRQEVVGQTVAFKTEKNKTFMPRREGESVFYVSANNPREILGWDWDRDVLRYGIRWGVIKKRKTKYTFGMDEVDCKTEDDAILVMNEKHGDLKRMIESIKDSRLGEGAKLGPKGFFEAEKRTRGGIDEEEDGESSESGDGGEDKNDKKSKR